MHAHIRLELPFFAGHVRSSISDVIQYGSCDDVFSFFFSVFALPCAFKRAVFVSIRAVCVSVCDVIS